MARITIALALAGSAAGQGMTVNIFATELPNTYVVGGEFFGGLPVGATSIVSIWADVGIELTGDGSEIDVFAYNPAYDTVLGSPAIANGPTASFVGNTNTFFGTPDPSDPLYVAAFTYDGLLGNLGLSVVGQNSAWFESPGFPFGRVDLYQDAFGEPGTLLLQTGFPGFLSVSTADIPWIPAPGTLAVAPALLLAARRRR